MHAAHTQAHALDAATASADYASMYLAQQQSHLYRHSYRERCLVFSIVQSSVLFTLSLAQFSLSVFRCQSSISTSISISTFVFILWCYRQCCDCVLILILNITSEYNSTLSEFSSGVLGVRAI